MFIKKLIIDGFKSYGKRVEITDFDPSFNAITGFNGSGKSNILDAICFVLGLSKLELARCHTLNDLIYKNGNAGVKTASVTMEIDNSDGKFSHSDYRDSPVIVVRREINLRNQSKYYIEGFCVTKEKLMDFFQSVSLNIQNPHFLIMQGKIVKVVSMKPTEILSMIEEAVGVSVYETKKKHNLIKIGKCDNTLNEINYMIDESIRPKLDQVLNEQKVLNEYNQMKTNYQKMIKLSIAMRYLHDKRTIETSDNNIKMNENIIEEKEQIKAQIVDENEEIEKQIQNLQHSLDKNSSNELKQLEADVNEQQKIIQQIMTEKKMKQDQIESDTNEMKNLTTKLENETKLMHKSEAEYNKLKIDIDKLKSDLEMNEKQLHQAENNLEAINFGKSKNVDCNDGEQVTLTLTQQLLQAKDELNLIESSIHKSKLMIKQWQIELKDKSKQIDLDKNTYDQINADIQMKEKEMKQLENDIEKLEFNGEHFDEIKLKIQELKQNTSKLTDKLNELVPLVPMAKFNYAKFITDDDDIDPEQINGLVCDLFEINHPDIHSIAIEKVCGNRLFNVVVSDEQIAAKLIKRNRTERRTYLPLNKIQGRDTDMKALRLAEQMIGKGNVHYAINLIRFDPKLKNAMQYVFGDTMVCPNMNMAKKIAFTSGIMKRVVTYDGEIFDPSGTLTGGSNTANSKYDSILTVINTIKVIENELNMNKICRQQNEYEYEQIQMKYRAYTEKSSKLKLKIKEIDSLKLRQKETHYNQSLEEIETINQNIQNETNLIKNEYELNRQNLMEKIKNLEFKIENYDKFKQNELKEAQKELEMARKTLEKNKKLLDNNEKNFLKIEQQTIFHQESIKLIENQLKNLRQNIDNITEHIEKILNENLRKEEDKYQSIEQKLKIYKDNLMKQSKEIQKLQKKLIENNNKIDEIMREIKSKTYEINKIKADKKESTENIQKLLNKNQWILDEEKYFYSDHSEYQLLRQTNTNDGQQEFHKQLKLIKTKMETMKKSVNMKANIMHGQIQNEFEELLRKRDCTLKDRRKLIQYLDKVEKEKDKELRKAWEKINENFGAIFSTLLANTNARLQPISSKIQDGLEIKVSIGNVWKESLSELSGGQRSLVALSLVLSLLKYYPAPLYILDEIDAALDQSHTQNIGIMIRKHFKNAQFIIVSLKDDMFNNANVLFQTKFIDGYSTVERIEL